MQMGEGLDILWGHYFAWIRGEIWPCQCKAKPPVLWLIVGL